MFCSSSSKLALSFFPFIPLCVCVCGCGCGCGLGVGVGVGVGVGGWVGGWVGVCGCGGRCLQLLLTICIHKA